MPGRLQQAANEAGERMGLTKGQAARLWANIKAGLGRQAR
jgi:hypothetical protein